MAQNPKNIAQRAVILHTFRVQEGLGFRVWVSEPEDERALEIASWDLGFRV